MNTIQLGHSGSSLESGGLRRRSVRLSVGIVLGLGVLLAALCLLSSSGPQARAGLAPAAAEDVASQTAAAHRWLSETVDNSGWVGWQNSLALEPVAPYTPHISYRDLDNSALKHAWWTPSGWLSETVDNSGNVGWYTSLALESVAPYTPHISYRDADNTSLKHAWWTPTGWLSETVDNSGYVAGATSLALEPVAPCTPHISYYANTSLKHAWWTPTGWLSETVDNSGSNPSLALEPVAPYAPHISYYDITNTALKHAWWTPTGWLNETVDNSADVGYNSSLALEPAAPYAPHISYDHATNDALKHVWLPRWVLFDEAHGERNSLDLARAQQIEPGYPEWVYFGQLVTALAPQFQFERNVSARLTPVLLADYDILVLSAPTESFDAGEIAAIQQFVDLGGGLIVLGDCGLDHPANAFMPEYEISFDPHCIFGPIPDQEGDFSVAYFASHPAVANGSSFVTNWGQSLQFGSGATYLAWTDTDIWQDSNWNDTYDAGTDLVGPFTIVAGKDTGYGRVAAISDNSFQDDGFEWRGNAPLMRALLYWVAPRDKRVPAFVHLPLVLRGAP